MPRIDHCDAHGSEIGTLCVTTAIPWTSAVPTISASGIGRGSGIWSCADRFATAVSTAGIRFANAVNTRSFIQSRNTAPLAESRRSTRSTPISNSTIVTTETKRSVASMPSAQAETFRSLFPDQIFRNSETTFVSRRNISRGQPRNFELDILDAGQSK